LFSFSVGPFGRFYFGGIDGKGAPYVLINAGISFYPSYSGSYKPSTGSAYDYSYKKYTSWNAGIQLGYEHFINSTIGIQYYVGYTYRYYKTTSETDYTSGTGTDYTSDYLSKRNGISFGVGLQIHLGKKAQ
jgi:hypothetical protein